MCTQSETVGIPIRLRRAANNGTLQGNRESRAEYERAVPRPGMRDNLDLSAIRATNTFRRLIAKRPDLLEFKNTRDFSILSVSGYGEYRPAAQGEPTPENKAKNRRIDLRILMTTPRAEDAARFEREIKEELRSK